MKPYSYEYIGPRCASPWTIGIHLDEEAPNSDNGYYIAGMLPGYAPYSRVRYVFGRHEIYALFKPLTKDEALKRYEEKFGVKP